MIIRSARRKVQRDVSQSLQSFVNQLELPWLCPAFHGLPRHQLASRKTAASIRRISRDISTSAAQHSYRTRPVRRSPPDRGLAHAASIEHSSHDVHIPFDGTALPQGTSSLPSWLSAGSQSSLPAFNPGDPIVILDSMRLAPRRFRYSSSIGGEIAEIHQMLLACLRVGQFERASATIRRLNTIYKSDSLELISAHNAYIRAVVTRIVLTQDQKLLKHLHEWFQMQILAVGIRPNAETFALMVQATLNDSNEMKVGRTIRRYLALSKDTGIFDEARTAILDQISDQDAAKVTRFDESSYFPFSQPVKNNEQKCSLPDVTPELSDKSSPMLLPQSIKGLGLSSLQQSLKPLVTAVDQIPKIIESDDARAKLSGFERQKCLEESTISSALDRWRTEHKESRRHNLMNSALKSRELGAMMWTWHKALLPLIEEELQKIELLDEANANERAFYGPFLQHLKPETLSAVTILTCIREMTRTGMTTGTTTARLVCAVGKEVEEETLIAASKLKERLKVSISEDPQARAKRMSRLLRRERYAQKLSKPVDCNQFDSPSSSKAIPITSWSAQIRARIGAVLIAYLLQAAKLELPVFDANQNFISNQDQHAFTKVTTFKNGQRCGKIMMNRVLAEKFMKDPVSSAIAKYLPMLVNPRPWKDFNNGGYLTHPTDVVRFRATYTQTKEYIQVAAKNGDMAQIFAALDILGKTPWKINRQVFEVMVQVWNSGQAFANIPAANPKLEYPLEPSPTESEEARRAHAFKIRQLDGLRDGMHSNRCFQNFQLEVAKAFLDENLYFPHNMDFRGRAYPIPPYLNHMGADHCRGLLVFGDGKKLGKTGLMWLRVHVANVFGYDKASFIERKEFADNHIAEIYDSATNPLTGKQWWLKAEDPWQCLATCIELKNALDSSEPTEYISHLPIHQDGTCNGLQHYAALGGDAIGARQVNLEPGERPSDIYTAVAEMVKQDVAKDASDGVEIAQLLDGKVSRKVVKQTVMTNVYGVTFSGARMQVLHKLEELYPSMFGTDTRLAYSASSYLAKKIFAALSLMFNGAQDIQYWLGECASRISSSLTKEQVQWVEDNAAGKKYPVPFNKRPTNERAISNEHTRFKTSVIWTTPLKMPVVQPYRTSAAKRVLTNLQHINIVEPSVSDPVSKRKQLQAFPPNFIHSLDATHMFLSALKCDELGLSFAAVHDSFWTHASDVETMNGVLRDAFIRMHSEDIMGRLAAEFNARYSGGMYLAMIKRNSTLGKKISELRRSDRKGRPRKPLSDTKIDELLREKCRSQLLASQDLEKRAEGQAMVTPAKLFEEMTNNNDLLVSDDVVGTIGQIRDEPDYFADSVDEEVNPDELEANRIASHFTTSSVDEATAAANAKRAKSSNQLRTWAWLPLTFPPVPKKGSFDVTRLKDSKYFFS